MFPRGRCKVTLGSLLAHNWDHVVDVYVCRAYHICIEDILCTKDMHIIEIFDGKQELFNQDRGILVLAQGIPIIAEGLMHWDN